MTAPTAAVEDPAAEDSADRMQARGAPAAAKPPLSRPGDEARRKEWLAVNVGRL